MPMRSMFSDVRLKKRINCDKSIIILERYNFRRKTVLYLEGTDGQDGLPITSVLYDVSPSKICRALVIIL